MLSAETASGDYPLETVAIINRIMERVERDPLWPSLMDAEHTGMDDLDADALVAAARKAANSQSTACIVVFTTLGGTARRMARKAAAAADPGPDAQSGHSPATGAGLGA